MADEAVNIGPPHSAKSYLNVQRSWTQRVALERMPSILVTAFWRKIAEAIEESGLIFVRPRADTIRMMGDKVAARESATRAGVPVLPGSNGRVVDQGAACELAEQIGFRS
jgi:acetyl-CoA carboxylase biotin carboxylase subunit